MKKREGEENARYREGGRVTYGFWLVITREPNISHFCIMENSTGV